MISTYALLYLIMVFSVCCALSGFSLVVLPNSRRLMYIMAGIPTTLALEACCARYIIMRTAQHTSNNARSLCGGFLAIFNN
jgi:hypothetical protein